MYMYALPWIYPTLDSTDRLGIFKNSLQIHCGKSTLRFAVGRSIIFAPIHNIYTIFAVKCVVKQ